MVGTHSNASVIKGKNLKFRPIKRSSDKVCQLFIALEDIRRKQELVEKIIRSENEGGGGGGGAKENDYNSA